MHHDGCQDHCPGYRVIILCWLRLVRRERLLDGFLDGEHFLRWMMGIKGIAKIRNEEIRARTGAENEKQD